MNGEARRKEKPSEAKQEENSIKLVALSEAELIQKTEEAILKEEEKAIAQKQEDEKTDAEELTIIIEESPAFKELMPVMPTVSGGS